MSKINWKYVWSGNNKLDFFEKLNKVGILKIKNKQFARANLIIDFKTSDKIKVTLYMTSNEFEKLENIISNEINNCIFDTGLKGYYLYSENSLKLVKPNFNVETMVQTIDIYFDFCLVINYNTEINFKKNKFNKIYLKFNDLNNFCNKHRTLDWNNKEKFIERDIKVDICSFNNNYNFELVECAYPQYLSDSYVVVRNFNEPINKKKTNELNKKINELIENYKDENSSNGSQIDVNPLLKKYFQISITKKTKYFETPEEVKNIVLDIINIFSILCDKRINIDSISLETEDDKITSMVFNRPIFNDKKQIDDNITSFQDFIDNFENIFKNYFELKENKSWFVEIVNFFINMDKDYFLRYSNTLYTMLFENCCNVFTYNILKEVKQISKIDFKDKNEFIKHLKEILSKINENYNNKYSDFTDIIRYKFSKRYGEFSGDFKKRIKKLKEEENRNEFCKNSINKYFEYKLVTDYINNKEKVFNFFVKIVEDYNKVAKSGKRIYINKKITVNKFGEESLVSDLFVELRNYFSHYYDKEDEKYKYIGNIVENKNHELTNLTILLKYIIISEFLLELFNNGVKDESTREKNKEVVYKYFKDNVNFINTI